MYLQSNLGCGRRSDINNLYKCYSFVIFFLYPMSILYFYLYILILSNSVQSVCYTIIVSNDLQWNITKSSHYYLVYGWYILIKLIQMGEISSVKKKNLCIWYLSPDCPCWFYFFSFGYFDVRYNTIDFNAYLNWPPNNPQHSWLGYMGEILYAIIAINYCTYIWILWFFFFNFLSDSIHLIRKQWKIDTIFVVVGWLPNYQ